MRSVLIVIFVFFYLLLGLPVLGAMWIIHKFAPAWADMAQLRLVQCWLLLAGTSYFIPIAPMVWR